MQQKIAIIAAQRSGTHALGSVLIGNGYKNFDEVFLLNNNMDESMHEFSFEKFVKDRNYSVSEYISKPHKVFSDYLTYLESFNVDKYYIDIKYNALYRLNNPYSNPGEVPLLLSLLSENNFMMIHLTRENSFKRYISEIVGHHTNQFHIDISTPEFNILNPKIKINIEECLLSIRSHMYAKKKVSEWMENFNNKIELPYEILFKDNVISNPACVLLNKHLNLTLDHQSAGYKKPNRILEKIILNYDDVIIALAKEGYAGMI